VTRGLFFTLVVAAWLLVGCGGSAAQTAETGRYTVTFSLEGAGIGQRSAVIEVADREGRPATVDEVVLAPVMRDMGMASPEVRATPDGTGRYVARGDFFSMLGAWEIDVHIASGGVEETVSFPVRVE
jgi:hypothetical protein